MGKNIDVTISGPLRAPDCYSCASYYVTWEPGFPHGCKKFGVKCRDTLPSMAVYQAAKCHCQFFEARAGTKK